MDRFCTIILITTIISSCAVGCIAHTVEKYKQQEGIYFNGR